MITLPEGTTGVTLKMEANDDMDIELQDVPLQGVHEAGTL